MVYLLMTGKECGRIQPDTSTTQSETFLQIHLAQASQILFHIHSHGFHINEMDITMRKHGFPIVGSVGGIRINQT